MMLKRLLAGLFLVCAFASFAVAQSAQAQTSESLAISTKHHKEIEADIAQGKKLVEQVLKTEKVSKDEEMQKRVKRIGGTMADLANKTHLVALWGDKQFSKFDYDFTVLEGKDVNAFSIPGGH